MTRFLFEPGTLFALHGVAYRVLDPLDPDSVTASDLQTRQLLSLHINDLWKHWGDWILRFFSQAEQFNEKKVFLPGTGSSDERLAEGGSSPRAQREQAPPTSQLRMKALV